MRWLIGIGLALALAAAAGLAWLLGTEAGLHWTLARARAAAEGRLIVAGASGALAGTVGIERLAYEAPAASVEARGIRTRASLLAALRGRLVLETLHVQSATTTLRHGAPPKAGGPPDLPFGIALRDVAIARFELVRDGERHELRDLRLSHLALAPTLSAAGSLSLAHERFPLAASFEAKGSLERIELSTKLTVAGVPADVRAVVRTAGGVYVETVSARAGPLDLARFDADLPRTAISAQIDAKGALDALAGTLTAGNAAAGPLDEGRIPIARLAARFAARGFDAATLDSLQVALAGGGRLRGRAELERQSFRADLQAQDVDLRSLRSSLRSTRLRGPLQIHATPQFQRLSGNLAQDDVAVEAALERRGDVVEVHRLRASAKGGELRGTGRVTLEDLRFEAKLELAAVDPSAFGDYPAGSLNASLVAAGSRRQAELTWTLRESTLRGVPLESSGSAIVSPTRVTKAQAQASYGKARLALSGSLGEPGDRMRWQLAVPALEELAEGLAGALQASGSVSGSLSRHEIRLSATARGLALQARLRGGWRAGEGWRGEIASLGNAGDYPLQTTGPATLAVARERVDLGRLEARLGEGRLAIEDLRWQPGRITSSGEFRGFPARWLLALTSAAERVDSTLLLDGAWRLEAKPQLEGSVRIARAGGDLSVDGVALGLGEAALDGRFVAGKLQTEGRVASRFGELRLEGSIAPAPGASAIGAASPISLRARLELAALRVLAAPFLEDAEADGRIGARLTATGTLAKPALSGEVTGEALRFDMPRHGVHLRDGVLRARLDGDVVHVDKLTVRSGEGSFSASGKLPLRLASSSASLAWQARRFSALDRADARLVVSGQGETRFDGRRLSLTGDLRADRGHFERAGERLPQLGDDVVVVGEPRQARKEEMRLPLALDLMLDLGSELSVRAHGFDGKVAGRVQLVTNEKGELRAYGEVRAVNATFLAYGRRLQVDPGVLIFDGPLDNPSLQVTAWRRNQAVEAGVQISGTARLPRVQLVSQPPVPEGERLSWLVLGRAPAEASQADLGLLQAAAGALLASGDAMPLDRRLARSLGLDEVSLRGGGEVADRVVAFGKRLSDRVYVSYERGIGALASNLVKLDYALSRRWSLRAETGNTSTGTPTSGWGLFYRFSWD